MAKHQIDYRMLNCLRLSCLNDDSQFLTVDKFKKLFHASVKNLQRRLISDDLVQLIADHISLYEDQVKVVSLSKLTKIIDLYNYCPVNIRKNRNYSKELFHILSTNDESSYFSNLNCSKDRKLAMQKIEEVQRSCGESDDDQSLSEATKSLMRLIWLKIVERFKSVAEAFRYFDVNSTGKISLNGFMLSLENLNIKVTQEELKEIFTHLNMSHDGYLTF